MNPHDEIDDHDHPEPTPHDLPPGAFGIPILDI